MKMFKKTVLASAVLLTGFAGGTSAHEAIGALGTAAGAIDVYHTSCFSWGSAAAATQAGVLNGDTEVTGATGRFVARVAKKCATANSACGAASNTVTVTAVPGYTTPTPALPTGAVSVSTTTATGAGTLDPLSGLWVAPWSTFAQVANAGPYAAVPGDVAHSGKNGSYTVIVSHSSGVANNYVAQLHCEQPAVNALPAPSPTSLVHTGTGVTLIGNNAPDSSTGFDAVSGLGTTGGDFNQTVNQ